MTASDLTAEDRVDQVGKPDDLVGELVSWARGLRYPDIPPSTAALAVSQIIAGLATVRASMAHPLGRGLVAAFGRPLAGDDPKRSAHVLAALSMCLEYDEIAYSGHPSASCVNVALSYAVPQRLDGRQLIAAVVAANECATRFQAAMLLGSFFRGQSATYTHLVGAVAARMHAQQADIRAWRDAMGLAFGILPAPVDTAFLSSDAKVFVAATPVRMALDACDAALAGLTGPRHVLECSDGVLERFSDAPMPDAVVARLGERWHTDTLSFKQYPASGYLQSTFECVERIATRLGRVGPEDVVGIRVHASILTCLLQQKSDPFLAADQVSVSALTFSAGYGIATILLTGSFTPRDLAGDGVRDADRWALAKKVEVCHDQELTMRMIAATVPLGEALRQAGRRALQVPAIKAFGDAEAVLDALGPPADSFTDATMAIGARVEVELRDGSVLVERVDQATGMAGPATRRDHREIVAERFRATGGPVEVLRNLDRLDELDADELNRTVTDALA
ncbi:MAG TPA: MmgE/PrpD family protein [Pseudonocardiaceae bacterium]|jgi:2-methylcitrate dehydratase PrpD|nr:MmgE/PrpD family protein [Pseudonocardiaceae bacterium]